MKNRFKKIMAFLFLFLVFSCTCSKIKCVTTEEAAWISAWEEELVTSMGTDTAFQAYADACMYAVGFRAPGQVLVGQFDFEPGTYIYTGELRATDTPHEIIENTDWKELFGFALGQAKTIANSYMIESLKGKPELAALFAASEDGTANDDMWQLIKERIALKILYGSLDNIIKAVDSVCTDTAEDYEVADLESAICDGLVGTDSACTQINTGKISITCSQWKTGTNMRMAYTSIQNQVINPLLTDNQKAKEKLIEEGKVDDEVTNWGEEVDEGTDQIIDDAGQAGQDASEGFGQFDYPDVEEIIGGKPELTLENLTNRVTGLIGFGKLDGLDDITNFVAGDIVNLVAEVGKYIIYAAILFMGVRIIWSGARGKAQFKEALPFLLTAIVFFYLGENVYYLIEGILYGDELNYAESVKTLWGSIIDIIRILAFGGIMFTGLKFLFASGPDGRADVKASLLPILIGCILVFASSTIVSVVINVSKESGLDQVSKEENTSENIFLDELEYKIEV